MSIEFNFLPAGSGDCILFKTADFAALIDSGDAHCYKEIKNYLLSELNSVKLNLIILTHIDDDHIGGMRKLLNDSDFFDLMSDQCEIWMNYPQGKCNLFPTEKKDNFISYRGGDLINQLALKHRIKHINQISTQDDFKEYFLTKNLSLTLLSPDKIHLDKLQKQWEAKRSNSISGGIKSSDYIKTFEQLELEDDFNNNWIPNGSSIAFILHYDSSYNFLFLADAYPKVIIESLNLMGFSKENPLKADFIKISHHGSKLNNTRDLFNYIDSNYFIFLTNSIKILPHKKTLSRISNRNHKKGIDYFIFNYEEPMLKVINDSCIKSNNIDCLFSRKLIYGKS